jgi:hypothetical protein
MADLKVIHNNEQVGTVETEREGLFLTLRCSTSYFPQVMRLYGVSPEGYVPIGIPVPVGGRLRLTKKYTNNDLKAVPTDSFTHFELFYADETPEMPVVAEETVEPEITAEAQIGEPEQPVECPLEEIPDKDETVECEAAPDAAETEECAAVSESPWRLTDDPGALFHDPELMETASVIRGGMVMEDEGSTLFAIPISSDAPFPLMPVFRYGWSAMVEGKCCIVFRIKDGELV